MDDTNQDKPARYLPFNNLYLISGLVHGSNKAWMYFFTLILIVFGYTGFQLAIFYPLKELLIANGYGEQEIMQNVNLLFDSDALKIDRNIILLLELLMFVFAFIGFYIGIKYIHNKTLTSLLTGYEKFRFKRFFFAFIIWGGMIIVTTAADYLLHPLDYVFTLDLSGLAVSVLIMVFLMPIQTGCEEVIFRGYFIQGLSQVFRNGIIPLVLTSLLFASAHMSNPEVKQFGWPIMFTYFAAFAFFMGSITLIDEGLELAFGIHLANNMISSILVSSPHSVIKTYSIFDSPAVNPFTEIILWVFMAGITFGIFWWKYKWKNFKLLIK